MCRPAAIEIIMERITKVIPRGFFIKLSNCKKKRITNTGKSDCNQIILEYIVNAGENARINPEATAYFGGSRV